MKKLLVISVLAMAIMGSAMVEAGHKGHKVKRGAFYDETEVVNVEPITRTVRTSIPKRECWQEEVYYSDAPIHAADAARNVFIGGIVGGIIGHQFGSGRGKDAATLAGTLIGASVAHGRAKRKAQTYSHERVVTEERCRVVEQYQTEERIDGYWVTYRYQGESFTTRMPFDPGSSLRVRVQVSPVRDSVTF